MNDVITIFSLQKWWGAARAAQLNGVLSGGFFSSFLLQCFIRFDPRTLLAIHRECHRVSPGSACEGERN